ncbi:type VII secretion integral membrane protein EccD [Jatrophihabitans endophyticus]|uniref:Type VII secretion integral membrane protein EccD n=1 Tax=Jatrophihabitans endophyticus TaxID=1206085 RepID=A0A1M5H9H0_9ACTN|nr:type VII secretion integral membrane protein EccD [Jatrophihabitans endophyticus]SHG12660.1 type VII secretion integral membrane protein EccD [Jatrophihabitans endophyticus]
MVAPSPLSGFSRITLSAPRTRADVAVPNSVPVAAFLPVLLRQVGQDDDAAVPGHGGWRLCRLDGRTLDLARSMDGNEIRDGDVLVLQPVHEVVDDPLFDDVVELVGRDSVRERWTARERRATAAVIGGLAMLAALAALARMPRHEYLEAAICVAVAAVLLLGGLAVSRAAGDLGGGAFVAALAGPFAAVGAALFVHGPWDRQRLLIACAALLLVAALLPALVGGYESIAGGFAMLALFGGIAGLVLVLADVTPARCAAVVAPLALAATTMLPALSLRLARLPRPELAFNAADLAELPGEVDQARTAGRVANARALLAGLTAGALCVTAVGVVVLAASPGWWARALAGVLVALVLLRARLFAARRPVLITVAAAAVALAGLALVALSRSGERPLILTAVVAAAVALAALGNGLTAGRWVATPRQRRLLDLAETVMLVAVAPLVLGVWHVYATIYHLGD